MTRTLRLGLVLALSFSLVVPSVPASAAGAIRTAPEAVIAGEAVAAPELPSGVIAKPKSNAGIAALGAGAKIAGKSGDYVADVPDGKTAEGYARELRATGRYEYVSPNYKRQVLYSANPNDPDLRDAGSWYLGSGGLTAHAKSWGLRGAGSSNFDQAWTTLTADGDAVPYHARATAAAVKVAVIDTGFYMNHPDRAVNIEVGRDCAESYNAYGAVAATDNDVTPPAAEADKLTASHGTIVASEIAQASNNAVGGSGATYDGVVRVYKVLGTEPGGVSAAMYDSAIIDAIRLAADDGCRVISISLGGSPYSQAGQAAIDYAHGKGAVVVAATGNDGVASVMYPAAYENVIGVGAARLGGGTTSPPLPSPLAFRPERSSFSNYGTGTDIVAPGSNIWGPTVPGWDAPDDGANVAGYTWWSGTSMATPLVSAAASLVLRYMPSLTPEEVEWFLEDNARDIGAVGDDSETGNGYLDMGATYARMKSDYPNLTRPVVSGISSGGLYNRSSFIADWTAVSGYQVRYGASIDGSSLGNDISARTVALSGLADGYHVLTVSPASSRNWNAGSAVGIGFTVDTEAPAAPAVGFASRRVSWTESEPLPRTTHFSLDATSSPVAVASGYYDVPAGIVGDHVAYVRTTDDAGNAGPWGSVAFTIIDPPGKPVLNSSYGTAASSYTLSWPAVPTATSYDVQVGSAPATTVTVPSIPLEGLAPHATAVTVTARNAGGPGSPATTSILYELPAPVPPTVSAAGSTAVLPVTVSWTAVPNAERYEVRVGNGTPTSTTGLSQALSSLVPGVNTVSVRAVNFSASSAWSSATVAYTPPLSAPSLVVPSSITGPGIAFAWSPLLGAVSYEWSVDGGAAMYASGTTASTTLSPGTHTISVRGVASNGTPGPWGSATTTYYLYTSLSLSASPTTLAYGKPTVLSGTLRAGGGTGPQGVGVLLERSTGSGANWSYVRTVTTGPGGSFSTTYAPGRNVRVRMRFAGSGHYTASASVAVALSQRVYITAPTAPKSTGNKPFYSQGYLMPRRTAGTYPVKVKAYRYEKSGSTYKWVLKKTFSAKASNYGTYSKYAASVSLPYDGRWRLIGSFTGTSDYVSTSSPYRYLTAK